ncbi:MAG: di-heme oxidoredictase family protein [Microthrixaceae bacterium]
MSRAGRAGFPPTDAEDTSTLGLLLRLSVPGVSDDGGPLPEPAYGGQLQDRAVDGVDPEGVIELDWVTETRNHADGATYELRRPDIDIVEAAHGPLADDVMISPRLAPQVIGVGLLEAIPEQSIRDAADPDDADGDGISGRVNLVPDPRSGEELVGRFGWKANVGTVEAQIAGAFLGDIGITSPLFPDENCGRDDVVCADAPGGGDPEVPQDTFERVVFYNRTLAVPAMRDPGSPQVRAGAEHFTAVGCAGCHTTTQTTGSADIDMLSDQTISPFTDLLLHDLGEGLADGRPDFGASGSEWRTPPLWGLGLVPVVNGERFMMHDGRARTFEEAIMWHGGEAQASADAFSALAEDERTELIAYLEAL